VRKQSKSKYQLTQIIWWHKLLSELSLFLFTSSGWTYIIFYIIYILCCLEQLVYYYYIFNSLIGNDRPYANRQWTYFRKFSKSLITPLWAIIFSYWSYNIAFWALFSPAVQFLLQDLQNRIKPSCILSKSRKAWYHRCTSI
jgi:hypothetical protein